MMLNELLEIFFFGCSHSMFYFISEFLVFF